MTLQSSHIAGICVIFTVFFSTVSSPIASSWGDQGDGTYKNPILNADYSDPDLIRVGSDFYMVCSEFHFMGIPVLHSKDLVNWKIISRIYHRLDISPEYSTFDRYGKGSWAPSIRYYNGRFYVYFCTPDEGLFMSSAADPAGPWDTIHTVKAVKGWEDPCPFWDDDGSAYLGHAFVGCNQGIWIHRMSPDGRMLLDEGQKVYDGPCAEGTKIFKRNGWYYLFIPEGGVENGWQTACRSRSIYGPYESRKVLQQGTTSINGPHQGGLVDLENGESWFIHFQSTGAIGRICHLQPVKWIDDWPQIGINGEPVLSYTKPNVNGTYPISVPQTSDEFTDPEPGLQWQTNHNPVESMFSLTERPGFLRIKASMASDVYRASNTMTQKIMGRKGEATISLHINGMEDGQIAGLTIMNDRFSWIGVEKSSGSFYVRTSIDGEVTTGPVFSDSVILLKAIIDLDNITALYYSLDGTTFQRLGGNCILKFGFWKGSRIAIFTYNTTGTAGFADFDYFRYTFDGPQVTDVSSRKEIHRTISENSGNFSFHLNRGYLRILPDPSTKISNIEIYNLKGCLLHRKPVTGHNQSVINIRGLSRPFIIRLVSPQVVLGRVFVGL